MAAAQDVQQLTGRGPVSGRGPSVLMSSVEIADIVATRAAAMPDIAHSQFEMRRMTWENIEAVMRELARFRSHLPMRPSRLGEQSGYFLEISTRARPQNSAGSVDRCVADKYISSGAGIKGSTIWPMTKPKHKPRTPDTPAIIRRKYYTVVQRQSLRNPP